jgi:hypothetical protein
VWNLDLVEEEETIVHGIVPKLGTNVTNVDVLKRLVCLQVTDLNTERGGSIRLAVDHELSHNDGIVGSTAERAYPPLACCEMGRVDSEGLVIRIPGSSGLQSADVGAVAELSLGITSNNLVVVGLGEPFFLLFWCTLSFKRDLLT